MAAIRSLLCLVWLALAAVPASAQLAASAASAALSTPSTSVPDQPPRGEWLPGGRSYLGLNMGRAGYGTACGGTTLFCDESERPTQLFVGTMVGNFWGVELGYSNLGRLARVDGPARTQGLNLSLVGQTRLLPSVGLFGKVGTTYGRSETSAMGAAGSGFGAEQGFGLSYGAGLSVEFTPRLSATLEWDSTDFRLPGAGREPVRSTSLGLKYRY
jgi:OOP family OmpA-OmpF porin